MITFERTSDLALIREILTDGRLWRRMTDDAAPAPEHFKPTMRDRLVYVLARCSGHIVGLFVLVCGFHESEVHFAITPEAWGRGKSRQIGREFLSWVWRETSLTRLVGPVPAHNRLALKLAKECGFEPFGLERNTVVKNGKMYDRILLEARR